MTTELSPTAILAAESIRDDPEENGPMTVERCARIIEEDTGLAELLAERDQLRDTLISIRPWILGTAPADIQRRVSAAIAAATKPSP